ncbi:RluA family pseudouridine synthase [Thiomicrorhabdus indica]|uniref:RluA family pseudouridine synthase n=1 Tax=Thiomicrorhabdus indica TaxID=2267253 RepID=UPI001F0E7356|nr:RluA family pseudouridine synthase [Thiomicrorhabdus indica]
MSRRAPKKNVNRRSEQSGRSGKSGRMSDGSKVKAHRPVKNKNNINLSKQAQFTESKSDSVVLDAAFQKVQFFEVTEEDQGQRLDNFLMRFLRRAPKTFVYRIVRKGEVRVNKKRAKANQRLEVGDMVRVPPVRLAESTTVDETGIPQEELNLIERCILFEDKDLMVINKPSGVAVHGGSGVRYGLIEVLRALRPLAKRLELVHRIDRDTSGCLLVAKKASVLKALHQQMREDKFEKRYLAITSHPWPEGVKRVDVPLQKIHLQDGGWHVKVSNEGKEALSFFRVKQSLKDMSLVEVKLKTGRTHQIRVHALSQGCALLGDDKYGDRELNKRYRKLGMKRLALHAQFLGFVHPATEERLLFEAPLWSDFERIIQELSIQ